MLVKEKIKMLLKLIIIRLQGIEGFLLAGR